MSLWRRWIIGLAVLLVAPPPLAAVAGVGIYYLHWTSHPYAGRAVFASAAAGALAGLLITPAGRAAGALIVLYGFVVSWIAMDVARSLWIALGRLVVL